MEAETLKLDNVIEVLNRYGREVVAHSLNYLEFDNSIASGELLKSIKYIIDEGNMQYELSIELADYWYYVNNGRKAGKYPPIEKISQWIRKKPLIPYRGKNGKLPTLQQLTYLISRKIAKEGTKGTHFFDRAIENSMKTFEDDIKEALQLDIGDAMRVEIKQLYSRA